MPGTFSQLYIQLVFAVSGRKNFIKKSWEEDLYKYTTGIVQGMNQKMLAINGMPDHIHILFGMRPTCCLSDFVREVKKSSNTFAKNYVPNFKWQEGYGAFSYSHSALDSVINYIMNQKEHHRKRSFKEEYLLLLKRFEIEFKEEYIFEFYD